MCSDDAGFACCMNKCWTEFFLIINSVQLLSDCYFSSSNRKNRKFPIL